MPSFMEWVGVQIPVRAIRSPFGEKMPGLGRYLLSSTKHRLTVSLAAPSCCYKFPSSKEGTKTCAGEDRVGHGQKGSSESPAQGQPVPEHLSWARCPMLFPS